MYGKPLADAMTNLGCMIIGLDGDRGDDDTDWARALFQRVGPRRAGPVFRSLTKILHPDNAATGDVDIQRELNAAHGEITGRKAS